MLVALLGLFKVEVRIMIKRICFVLFVIFAGVGCSDDVDVAEAERLRADAVFQPSPVIKY